MVYQGSKNRLAKYIVPIIQKYIDNSNANVFIDCFVGGANLIDKISCERKIASDINPDLIALLKYIQQDNEINIAPESCDFEHYADVRENRNTGKYSKEYVALIGYCASYGGRYWDGGYGRAGKRNLFMDRLLNLKRQAPNLKGVEFTVRDYKEYENLGIKNAVIYCDPPYKGVKQYGRYKIDYERFYDFCRRMSQDNIVVVSEYDMPDDFECIWRMEYKTGTQDSKKIHIKTVNEKLFIHKSIINKNVNELKE